MHVKNARCQGLHCCCCMCNLAAEGIECGVCVRKCCLPFCHINVLHHSTIGTAASTFEVLTNTSTYSCCFPFCFRCSNRAEVENKATPSRGCIASPFFCSAWHVYYRNDITICIPRLSNRSVEDAFVDGDARQLEQGWRSEPSYYCSSCGCGRTKFLTQNVYRNQDTIESIYLREEGRPSHRQLEQVERLCLCFQLPLVQDRRVRVAVNELRPPEHVRMDMLNDTVDVLNQRVISSDVSKLIVSFANP